MQAFLNGILFKCISLFLSVLSALGVSTNFFHADSRNWKTNYTYVFVHGLSGWGSYDSTYKLMPYWGMFGGDLMAYLRAKGFDCYAASVSGNASAWDRACELYAQLTGTVVDYGKEHSDRCGHARFGEDYTGRALIGEWNEEKKINLLGHSFGGATVRLFADILEDGSAAEAAVTPADELSDFFKGGKGNWVYSITSLAAPHNGTTAYNVGGDADTEAAAEDAGKANSRLQSLFSGLMQKATGGKIDDRIADDYASYDMYIDHALALNETIETRDYTYYFSVPCSATVQQEDGTYAPVTKKMESLFVSSSAKMGAFTGVTAGGYEIGAEWQENDGLVNTISAKAPFNAPSTDYDAAHVDKGVWNIMPTYDGDHMSLQGGLLKPNDIKSYYTELLSMINSLNK